VNDHDARVDIFSLARVAVYILYGGPLPDPYAASNMDLIDCIYCDPAVKKILRVALSIEPGNRQCSLAEFLDQLEGAVVKSEQGARLGAVKDMIAEEHEKAHVVVRHAFLGTLFVMIVARPVIVLLHGLTAPSLNVYLSNLPWVALFHAFIGSWVWGSLIPIGFLMYSAFLHLEGKWGYVVAAAICGLAGFIGGAVCAAPAILVTNPGTLYELGWIAAVRDSSTKDRLHDAIMVTKMFWAFPITGLFTGLGAGFFLNAGVKELTEQSNQHVIPVPAKAHRFAGTTMSSFLFVFRARGAHLALLAPIVFPWVVMLAIGAQLDSVFSSIGEGIVHYLGALGLLVGFFYRVVRYPTVQKQPAT
jgi:hypothetical protein